MTGGGSNSAAVVASYRPPTLSWQQRVLQSLQVLSASALFPGAAVWIIYSIHYGFFPYLVGVLPTQVFVFITVIIGFVFSVGLGYGFVCSAWLQIILIRSAKRSHPLLPDQMLDRLGAALVSALICSLFGALAWFSAAGKIERSFFYLFTYFFVSSFLMSAVFTDSDPKAATNRRLVALAGVLPIALLLVMVPVIMPVIDLSMEIMGFRSKPGELLLATQEASEQIEAIAHLYGKSPKTCAMVIRGRKMLLVDGGIILWKSAVPQAFAGLADEAVPPVMVKRDDVLSLPRRGAAPCQLTK